MSRILRDPASAGSRRVRALIVVAALVATGCRSPLDDTPEFSAEPLPELSEPAADDPIAIDDVPVTTPPSTVPGETGSTTTTGAGTPTTTSTTAPESNAAEGPTLGPVRVTDAAGDADPGPGYADGRLLAIDDLGTTVRVTVQLDTDVPQFLQESEVMGIGVDIYVSGSTESDYQLFADGGSDGWRGFLQTPKGFIDFPGAFRVGGDLVQFEVPWDTIGGKAERTIDGFVDWGKPNALGLVERSSDFLPDREGGGLLGG